MICVGIDVGRSSIKVAEVESYAKSFAFKRFLELPLSPDPTKDKKIEIIDHLRNLAVQYAGSQVTFVLALPQEKVSQRFLNFPFRERHKILKIAPFELEDDIPLSFEDAIFEAKIVRYNQKSADVLALAALKEDIQQMLDLSKDVGITANIVSAQGLALSNLLEKWSDPPPEKRGLLEGPDLGEELSKGGAGEILLDLGHSGSRVLFYEEGLLVAVRNLDWGGQNIINALGKTYSLNPVQARKEMEQKAFILTDPESATKDQRIFSETIENSLIPLVNQLRLACLEVQSQFQLTWARGHIVGGPSLMKGIAPHLTQKLELPFNHFQHFRLLTDIRFETDRRKEALCATALGMALEGLKKPRNPAVNFLKGEFATQSKALTEMWERWRYTATLCAVAFVAFFVYGILRESFMDTAVTRSQEVLSEQAENIAGKKGAEARPARLKKFLSQHKREVQLRDQARGLLSLQTPLDFLNQLSQDVPANARMEVESLTVDEDFMEVHGSVAGSNALGAVQSVLQNLARDKKVSPVQTRSVAKNPRARFGYRIRLDRSGAQ